jgi:hypothetical protein
MVSQPFPYSSLGPGRQAGSNWDTLLIFFFFWLYSCFHNKVLYNQLFQQILVGHAPKWPKVMEDGWHLEFKPTAILTDSTGWLP